MSYYCGYCKCDPCQCDGHGNFANESFVGWTNVNILEEGKQMKCKKCQKDPCVCQQEEDKQYRFDSRFIIDVARRKETMKQRRQKQREEKRNDATEK